MPNKVFKLVIDVDARKAKLGTTELEGSFARLNARVVKTTTAMARFTAIGLAAAVGYVVKIGSEFEQLRVQLETVTGSIEKAERAFSMIKDFAATTPFQVAQLTEAFAQLKAKGIEPTQRDLAALGNLAAAFGKDIMTAQLAVTGAMFGEAEMLKQFGIILRYEGDQAKLTFQGMTTSIERDSQSIYDALVGLSEANFAGAMIRQSLTLKGRLSTLKDAFAALADEINSSGGVTSALGTAVAAWTHWINQAVKNFGLLGVAWNNSVAQIIEGAAKAGRGIEIYLRVFRFLPGITKDHADEAGRLARTLEDMAEVFRNKANVALEAHVEGLGAAASAAAVASGAVEKVGLTAEEAADRMDKLRDVLDRIHGRMMDLKDAIAAVMPELKKFDEVSVALRDYKPPSVDELFGAGTEEFLRQQDATAEKAKEIWISFSRSVQSSFSDAIFEMLDGNLSSFKDFFSSVFDLFKRMIAEMIAYAIANKILVNVGIGGAAAGAAGGASSGLLGGLFGGAGGGALAGGTAQGMMVGWGAFLMAAAPAMAIVAAAVLLKMNKDAQDRKQTIATGSFGASSSGGFFGNATSYSGHTGTAAELDMAMKQLVEAFTNLEKMTGGTLELTERIRFNVKGHGKVWLAVFDELGNFVSEKQFDSFEAALKAGTEQLLSTADLSGSSEAFAEVLAMAVRDGLERTMEKLDFLASFEDQLASALGVSTPGLDSTLQAIQQLKDGIWALGLSAAETAKLMAKAHAAEADRNKELRAGAFSNLADMLERAGIRQMEADRFRAKVEQQLFQLQLKKLEAEFRALDMWNELLENIFADLGEFAKSIGNFTQKIEEVTEGLGDVVGDGTPWKDNWKKVQAQFQDFVDSILLTGFQLQYRQVLSTIRDWKERLKAAGSGASQDLIKYLDTILKPKLIKQAWEQFLQPLVDFQEQARSGALSTSSLQQKYAGSRAKFFDLVERARAGDQDAIQALAGASQDYLQLAQQMFGTTDAYKRIFDEVMALIDGIVTDDDLMRKVIDEQHDEMLALIEATGVTAHELAQMQLDELIKIRVVLEGHTRQIQTQTSTLERLEVN